MRAACICNVCRMYTMCACLVCLHAVYVCTMSMRMLCVPCVLRKVCSVCGLFVWVLCAVCVVCTVRMFSMRVVCVLCMSMCVCVFSVHVLCVCKNIPIHKFLYNSEFSLVLFSEGF